MGYLLLIIKDKVESGVAAFKHAILPRDRPSPLFLILTTLVNGSLMGWTFSILTSSTCSQSNYVWMCLGLLHCFVTNSVCILLMARIRYLISRGIDPKCSNLRLYLTEPLIIFYIAYIIWMIVWMATVSQKSTIDKHSIRDDCSNHFNVQVGYFVCYLLSGTAVFWLTFGTEFMRSPRWRGFASSRWYMRYQPELALQLDGVEEGGSGTLQDSVNSTDTLPSSQEMETVRPTKTSPDPLDERNTR